MPKISGVVAAKVETGQGPARLEEMVDLSGFEEVALGRGEIALDLMLKTGIDPMSRIVAGGDERRLPKPCGQEKT